MSAERIRIEGERVVLRPLRADEFEHSWAQRVAADPAVQPVRPSREQLRERFERSGIMTDRRVDLAVEAGGRRIGEIQTYVPPGRPLAPGAYEVGIALDPEHRGQGYGTEAVRLFVGWLFREGGATEVHMPTTEANTGMRTVLERLGFTAEGTVHELGHDFLFYVVTRQAWEG